MWKYPGKIPVTSKQSMVLGLFYNLPIILSLKQSDIYTWSKKKKSVLCSPWLPQQDERNVAWLLDSQTNSSAKTILFL